MSLFRRGLDWSDLFPEWGPSSSFVGSKDAMRLVPVFAAVSLIADSFSSMPESCYRGDGTGRKPFATPAWLAKPDPRLSKFDWSYQFVTSLKLRGNAYGLVLGRSLTPDSIRWLNPDKIRVDEDTEPGVPIYWHDNHPKPLTLHSMGGRLIHIRDFVQPGSVEGLSPIGQFKQVWETAHYAVGYGHDWFEKSAVPPALLTAKTKLNPGDAAEAKKLFKASAADGLVTLDTDWDYKTLTIAPNEAQFLETIKASATLVANIFRVPPEDIGGEVGNSRTYGNREADAERFNVRTMLPLVTRYELAFSELLPDGAYLKRNMDVLARPSLMDRSKAYSENLRNGSITLSEVRELEDRPPLSEADIDFWQEHYLTQKTASEQIADAVTDSIPKEA